MPAATLFGIVGALIGAIVGGLDWAVMGFAVGLFGGQVSRLRFTLEGIERRLGDLENKLRHLETRTAAPSTTQPAHPAPVVAPRHPLPEDREPIAPRPAPAREGAEPPRIAPPPVPPAGAVPPLPPVPVATGVSAPDSDEWRTGLRWLLEFFTTGNVVAKLGVVIVFFGAAFLVRYAADRGLLPIEYRLMGLAGGALVLQGVGWRLRHSRAEFAMALQGGAIGILYLTIFAAFRLYSLLPATLTFVLLFSVVVFSAVLAVLQNERVLAVLGTGGGFMAPILASTGAGSHVGLFTYYLILNLGVLGIAWFRAWRILNWIGFVFTFGIGFYWGVLYYRPALFGSTEPFLIAFFLFYLTVTVLFAHRQPPRLRGYVDGSLVFGTPAFAFSMQSVMVRDIPFGRAFSAVALSALYLGLARALSRRQDLRAMTEAFMALGVVFLILAVPFAFDGHGTAAAWALEGAGLVWVGVRQQRIVARSVGVVLLIGAGLSFGLMATRAVGALPVLNSRFLGCTAVAAGSLLGAYQYFKAQGVRRDWEAPIELVLLLWGLSWWAGAVAEEITAFAPRDLHPASLLLALVASVSSAAIAGKRLAWPWMIRATLGALPLMWLVALAVFDDRPGSGPLPDLGWVAWPASIGISYALLWHFERKWPPAFARAWHAGTAWLVVFLLTWTAADAGDTFVPDSATWGSVAWSVVPSVLVLVLFRYGDRLAWPVRSDARLYAAIVPSGPVAFVVLWVIWACLQDGDAAPLPYVPVINPLELAQGLGLIAASAWRIRARDAGYLAGADSLALHSLALVAFLALNAVVARIVHAYLGVPFAAAPLAASAAFQAGISVLWALTALSLMTLARRRVARPLWLVGASLLGVLVLKLFLVDLGQVGAIARIVSFLVTGVLILIIGYVAPAPPREPEVA